jgi:putative membrane protein
MIPAGFALAAVAAALHVYIFWLESLAWTTPRARAVFGTTPDQAATTRQLAFNQGFYNLFLTIEIAVGIVAYALGATAVGATLVLVGAGSMVAAAVVLVASDRTKARAALIQGAIPAIAIVLTAVGLAG